MDASIYVLAPQPPTALILDANAFSLTPLPTLLSLFCGKYNELLTKELSLKNLFNFKVFNSEML
jgi:hypothetical protein